jgi:RimJ/RimL family protein N-acetyltransferase
VIRAERTEDIDVIKPVVVSVWDTIAEDGIEHKTWVPNPYRTAYIAVFDDDTPVGILSAVPMNASALHVHIHIPPESRGSKYEIGAALIEYITEVTEFTTLIAYIPVIYENVRRYAERLGFEDAGLVKRAHLKNGDRHDMTVMQLEVRE